MDLDGAGQGNVTTPPTSDAAGLVTWLPSQAETNADYVTLLGVDAAGDEWEPLTLAFETKLATSVEAILVDTAEIGAAGAGLTALGDARLANLDALVSSRGTADPGDAMALTSGERTTLAGVIWNALVSGLTTVGSVGKRIVDYLDAAVSSLRSIAVSQTEAAAVASGTMALTLYGSFDQTVESNTTEDLSAADELIWAVKEHKATDADADALILVREGVGLERLAKAALVVPVVAADGTLTLGGVSGAWTLRCQLVSSITGELVAWAERNLDAQIKAIFGDRTVSVWEGKARIHYQTIREV